MKFNIIFKGLVSKDKEAFTVIELLVVVALMAILASLSVPSLLRWIYNERINSYIRELQEFITLTIREARRWGGTCTIKPNLNWHSEIRPSGLTVDCKGIGNSNKRTIQKGPNITKHIFQEVSGDLKITPKGQLFISNSTANINKIVFMVGGRNNSGTNKPKCIMFEQPVGLHKVGSYNINYNFYSSRNASRYNNSLSESNCR